MKTAVRLVTAALLLIALGTVILERRAISILRAENEGLKAAFQSREQTERNATGASQHLEAELARLRAETEQLPKLRGELMRLRGTTNELTKLQQEQQRLAAENQRLRAAPPTDGGVAPTGPSTLDYLPRDKWTFAGYATPAAALQSTMWAASQGDPKSFLAGLAPEIQAQMQKQWANKTDAEIAEEMKRDSQKMAGYQILKSEKGENGALNLTVFLDGENKAQKIEFRRLGEEWKMSPH